MQFFTVALLALAATISTAAPQSNSGEMVKFTSCGTSADSVLLDTITVTPDPPVLGKAVTLNLKGKLSKVLDLGSKMHLKANIGTIKVKDETYDMCSKAQLPCPIAVGQQTINALLEVPSNIPPGVTINMQITGTNKDGSAAFCLTGSMKFARGL